MTTVKFTNAIPDGGPCYECGAADAAGEYVRADVARGLLAAARAALADAEHAVGCRSRRSTVNVREERCDCWVKQMRAAVEAATTTGATG